MKTAFAAFVSFAIGGLILYLLYFRRAVPRGRLLLAAGAACCLMAPTLAPERMQFAVQEFLSARCGACGAVRVELEPRPVQPRLLYSGERRSPGIIHPALPIRVEGLGSGLEVLMPRKPAELWCMGRKVYAIADEGPPGHHWLSIDMDAGFFTRYSDSPLDLDGAIELTLLKQTASLPAPAEGAVAVPGIGVCSPAPAGGSWVWLNCLTPAPRRALALEFPGGGRQWIVTRSSADTPSPATSQFAPLVKVGSQTPFASAAELTRLRLVSERPVLHIRAPFHLKAIRLAAYRQHLR